MEDSGIGLEQPVRKVSKVQFSRIPPPPQQIYEYLNGHIVGHYIMKKALSVAIYNHFCDVTFGVPNPNAQSKNNQYQTRHQDEFTAKCRNYAREKFERDVNRQRRDSLALSDNESPQEEYLSPIVARVIIEASSHKVHLKKSNTLTFDSTGSSRPLGAIAENIASFLDVPYVRIDCSLLISTLKASARENRNKITPMNQKGWLAILMRGYTGETVNAIIGRLLKKAEFDLERAQRGIIFLDGMNRIGEATLEEHDDPIWHREQIIKELSALIDGKTIHFTRRSVQGQGEGCRQTTLNATSGVVREEEKFQINSANLFFICFGVEEEKERDRRPSSSSMDTTVTTSNISSQGISTKSSKICSDKSFQFANSNSYPSGTESEYSDEDEGLYSLQGLKQNKMVQQLLQEVKSSPIPQCQHLWGMKDVELIITPEALEIIAEQAQYQGAGEKGVRTILEKLLFTVKFEIPGTGVRAVEITEDTVLGKAPPIYHYTSTLGDVNHKNYLNTITEEGVSAGLNEFDQTIMDTLEL